MKYKVGDKVVYGEVTGVVTEVSNNKNKDVKVQWSDGLHDWTHSAYIVLDYRALYEQEKALREAAEAVIDQRPRGRIPYSEEFFKALTHYQQLKQQYNGKETKSNTTNDA